MPPQHHHGSRQVFIDVLAKAVQFAILTWLHRFAIFPIGYQWWAWVLLFFGDEFSYYWFPSCQHECFFSGLPRGDHSSQRYNLSIPPLRQTWTALSPVLSSGSGLPIIGFCAGDDLAMKAYQPATSSGSIRNSSAR